MQQEDDLRALAKIMEFGRAVSIFLFGGTRIRVLLSEHCQLEFKFGSDRQDNYELQQYNRNLQLRPMEQAGSYPADGRLVSGNKRCQGREDHPAQNPCSTLRRMHPFLSQLVDIGFALPHAAVTALYVFTLVSGYLCLLMAGLWMSRLYKHNLMEDVFNLENESFQQETRLMENEYSVNLPTKFQYQGRLNDGWINVVNPFRATIVLGTPGSGKSYAVVNNYIRQMISKGYSCYIYDYKFDDLSIIAYNTLLNNMDKYKVKPKFYVINFDDPRRSHRCNPINPEFMTDISDAYEASYTIMLNLNKTWIEKQGDFFVESPIILLAAIIWYLKIYKNGIYCTFPHAVELLNKPYSDLFTILTSYPELENYLSPFMDAWKSGAQDQLQGQIASAKIPLTRMISPQLYWVMTGNDFSLDINNPNEPKLLCVGNNPDRQNIYSAALGLYNSRIVKLINKKDN